MKKATEKLSTGIVTALRSGVPRVYIYPASLAVSDQPMPVRSLQKVLDWIDSDVPVVADVGRIDDRSTRSVLVHGSGPIRENAAGLRQGGIGREDSGKRPEGRHQRHFF